MPFYLLPHITTNTLTSATSQGLGGSKTLRGVMRNRVTADGVAMANVELRWLFAHFGLAGQQWAVGANFFADCGMTTQEYDADLSAVPQEQKRLFFRGGNDTPHTSAGLGIKVHMNSNFIVSADYGRAMSADDGAGGLYICMNYLF